MSNLTQALEKLDASIDRLDEELKGRMALPQAAQKDLFARLEKEKAKNKKIANGLDSAIGKIEKLLEA